jgi:hypothetical protein
MQLQDVAKCTEIYANTQTRHTTRLNELGRAVREIRGLGKLWASCTEEKERERDLTTPHVLQMASRENLPILNVS